MIINNENDLQMFIYNGGLQQAYKLNDIYVSKIGTVVSIKPAKNGAYKLKYVGVTKSSKGLLKFNYCDNGKITTVQLHKVIYDTFSKEKSKQGEICFIDGDMNNCSYDNLITVTELLNHYRNMNNIKLVG